MGLPTLSTAPRAPLIALALAWLGAAGAGAAELPEAVRACLECHSDGELSMELGDSSKLGLGVDGDAFGRSVHGKQLVCTDCHEKYDQDHPQERSFPSRRDYVLGAYTLCKKCHFDTYTRTLESVHYDLVKEGLASAPVCTDCHGAHDIQDPHRKQSMMARSCARCHSSVYDVYSRSVHGAALVSDDNPDVPACADCHTHHGIQDPTALRFRLSSPETCLGCHGDGKRMGKYGIPTDVATSYLADFHGVTASLSKDSPTGQVVVTCVDCHGVHEIASPKRLGGEVMKGRVEAACQKCHQGAAKDFPSAWLSHYRPSLTNAPLVYVIDLFYRIFIPFVVAGLILQVTLHLYRVAIRR